MNQINIPIINDDTADILSVDVNHIVNKIYDEMNNMYKDGYKPKYLILWHPYYSALIHMSGLHNSWFDPIAPKSKLQKIFGLVVIETDKPETFEVY